MGALHPHPLGDWVTTINTDILRDFFWPWWLGWQVAITQRLPFVSVFSLLPTSPSHPLNNIRGSFGFGLTGLCFERRPGSDPVAGTQKLFGIIRNAHYIETGAEGPDHL